MNIKGPPNPRPAPKARPGREASELTDLLATAISNEAYLWGFAKDHDHLQSMWETRITKETHNLNDNQAKAVTISQACAYALASQMIMLRMMNEMNGLFKLYSDIKSS